MTVLNQEHMNYSQAQVHLKLTLWSLDMDNKGNLFQEIITLILTITLQIKTHGEYGLNVLGIQYTHKGVLGFMIEPDGAQGKLLMLMNLI